MNKKLNIALILLIIGLITSISTANAYTVTYPDYEIVSHDVTVKQGETATITAYILEHYGDPLDPNTHFNNNALLFFTVKDKDGQVLATKTSEMKGWWWDKYPKAVCKFNTTNMPIGNHTLNIKCYIPQNKGYKIVEKDYQFNVI